MSQPVETPQVPWRLDRPALDGETVKRVIAAALPSLVGQPVRYVNRGWDNDVWVVGTTEETWTVLRFPRRKQVVPWIRKEVAVLDVLAGRVPTGLPTPTLHEAPMPYFPYPFVTYPWLRGEPGDSVDVAAAAEPVLAEAIGKALAAVHGVPLAEFEGIQFANDAADPAQWLQRIGTVRPFLEDFLPPALVRDLHPWLRGTISAPPAGSPEGRCLAHADLGAEHILVGPASGRLAAIIDWADADVEDPVQDLFPLMLWFGPEFLRAVLRAYGAADWQSGPEWERMLFYARCLRLVVIGNTLKMGDRETAERECALLTARFDTRTFEWAAET